MEQNRGQRKETAAGLGGRSGAEELKQSRPEEDLPLGGEHLKELWEGCDRLSSCAFKQIAWPFHGKTCFCFSLHTKTMNLLRISLEISLNSNKRKGSCFELLGYAYCCTCMWSSSIITIAGTHFPWAGRDGGLASTRIKSQAPIFPEEGGANPGGQLGRQCILSRLLLKKAFLHKLISIRG